MKISKHIGICILLLCSSPTWAIQDITEKHFPMEDESIMTLINIKYGRDYALNPYKISVTSKNNIVYLNGLVDSEAQLERAVYMAQATEGVTDVVSHDLKVKQSKHPLSGTLITAKIKGHLYKHLILHVKVQTKDGVVYLAGNVESEGLRDHVVTLAKQTHGVKKVESMLKVVS